MYHKFKLSRLSPTMVFQNDPWVPARPPEFPPVPQPGDRFARSACGAWPAQLDSVTRHQEAKAWDVASGQPVPGVLDLLLALFFCWEYFFARMFSHSECSLEPRKNSFVSWQRGIYMYLRCFPGYFTIISREKRSGFWLQNAQSGKMLQIRSFGENMLKTLTYHKWAFIMFLCYVTKCTPSGGHFAPSPLPGVYAKCHKAKLIVDYLNNFSRIVQYLLHFYPAKEYIIGIHRIYLIKSWGSL